VRALMLTADYPPRVWSGIGSAVASQAASLVGVGVDVHVLAPAPVVVGEAPAGGRGPVVHRLGRGRCPVRPSEFDLVHLHSLALSDLAFEIRRRFRLPVVYTAHSLLDRELEGVPGAEAWQRLQAAVLSQSDHVVFLSSDERAAAVSRAPALAARSSVVPNGVAPPPPARPAPEDAGPIVFAGRFTRTKGIALLEAIVRRLAGRRRFVVAGGHGDAAGHGIVAGLAAAFPEACRVVGWLAREALDELYARAGLVLMPSRYEPFGIVALEAMRLGAPVVAAGVGGLVEACGAGSGGRLVYSRDPDVWCAEIREILETPAVWRALRRRGPAYVARRHDPARLARRLLHQVYRPLGRVGAA